MTNQMTPEPSDAELVRRAKAGELDAFEALINRHERRVYSLALRMLRHEQDAEDVTQQTFLSVVEHLAGFREEASFSTWLLRIATHAALKVIRKRKGLDTVSLAEATEVSENLDSIPHPEFIADWRQSPDQLVQRNETRRLLDEALARLDERQRIVFLLRDVEGFFGKGNRRRARFERGQCQSSTAPGQAAIARAIDARSGRPRTAPDTNAPPLTLNPALEGVTFSPLAAQDYYML